MMGESEEKDADAEPPGACLGEPPGGLPEVEGEPMDGRKDVGTKDEQELGLAGYSPLVIAVAERYLMSRRDQLEAVEALQLVAQSRDWLKEKIKMEDSKCEESFRQHLNRFDRAHKCWRW